MDGIIYNNNVTGQVNYPRTGVSPITGQPVVYTDPFTNYTSPFKHIAYPGSPTLTFCGAEVNFDPMTLGVSKLTYETPELNDVKNLAAYYADWQCSYHVAAPPQALFRIEITVAWDVLTGEDFSVSEYASEIWTLQPQENQKSILQSGLLIDPFSPPGANNLVILPDIMKIGVLQALQNNVLTITPPASDVANYAGFIPYAQQTLFYMRNQITSVPSFTQVLQRQATIDINNLNGAFNTAIDNLAGELIADGLSTPGFILSTQGILSNYAVTPAIVPKMLPSYSTQRSVSNIDTLEITSYAGWRWSPPTIKPLNFRKMSLSQTFYWDEWVEGLLYIHSPSNDFPLKFSPATNPGGN
jgi:hypothetical protein